MRPRAVGPKLIAMNVGIKTIVPREVPEQLWASVPAHHEPEAAWVIEELPATPSPHPPISSHDRRIVVALVLGVLLISTGLAGRWLGEGETTSSPQASSTSPRTTPDAAVATSAEPSQAAAPVEPAVEAPRSEANGLIPTTSAANGAGAGSGSGSALLTTCAVNGTGAGSGSALGVATVRNIDRHFAEPDTDGNVLAVWLETGSTSTACLATPSEASNDAPTAPVTVYCAPRDMRIDDAIRHGLLLHVFIRPADDAASDSVWTGHFDMNVYQEGATYYGTPVPWADPYVASTYAAPEAASSSVTGMHDGSTEAMADAAFCYANGWAFDADHAGSSLLVRVLADGALVWSGPADALRNDVAITGMGDGHHGFWVSLAGLVTPDSAHVIRVQAQDPETGTWVDLSQTPRTITCSG